MAGVWRAAAEQLVKFGSYWEDFEDILGDSIVGALIGVRAIENNGVILPTLRELFAELPKEVQERKVTDWKEQILAAVRPALKEHLALADALNHIVYELAK